MGLLQCPSSLAPSSLASGLAWLLRLFIHWLVVGMN